MQTLRSRNKVKRNRQTIESITDDIERKCDRLLGLLRAKHARRRIPAGLVQRVAAMTLSRLREQGIVKPDEQRVRQLTRQAIQREFLEREARRYR